MSAEFVIPDPPWLVCKGDQSRIFELCPRGDDGFDMQILDADCVVLVSRRFRTREDAIRWGNDERTILLYEGWKDPVRRARGRGVRRGRCQLESLGPQRAGQRLPRVAGDQTDPRGKRAVEVYAGAPYLGMLTIYALFARFQLLTVSLMKMNTDGSMQPSSWTEWQPADKWVHAATEILLRGLQLDDEPDTPTGASFCAPAILRGVAVYSRRRLTWSEAVLVKYGSARFLRPALNEGTFRISPAHTYDDPSLNFARRDAELERVLIDAATEMTSTIRPRPDEYVSGKSALLYSTQIRSAVDYYIFCLAGGWHLRLFNDFDADACLVITDPLRFVGALREAARSQLPDWHFGCKPVRYFDPVRDLKFLTNRTQTELAPFFCKDFRYAY